MLNKFRLVLGAGALLAAVGATAPTAAQTTINAASCWPIGSPVSKPFEALVDRVNELGDGVIQVNMVGGAPAIGSPFTLVQKMSKGAYDMVGCTEAYFGNVLPEAPVLRFAEVPYSTLRENGGIEYMQKLFNEKNIHFLARHNDFGPFHLWLNQPIDKPDLTGLHLRVSPVYTAFFTSLGATVQTSNLQQIYTYMENNTVQGYGWPALGWIKSWVKVTKYRVEPGFYNSTIHTLLNLDTWEDLSQEAKDVLIKVGMEFEARSEPNSKDLTERLVKQKAWMASEGMETISFEGAERETWLQKASDAGWKEVLDRSPEHGPKLKALFTK
jgi:TRAP-type C4-dicarboxylate transport system substrate-binding protein